MARNVKSGSAFLSPQVHLKNRELENTKLTAELQVLKSVDVNKENAIVRLKEEVGRLEACVAEKEKLQREILAQASATVLRRHGRRTFNQEIQHSRFPIHKHKSHAQWLVSPIRARRPWPFKSLELTNT